jgi:hypothetical protein
VDRAESAGLCLRVLGATAIKLHCPRHRQLFELLKRKTKDIDFGAYRKQKNEIIRFVAEQEYIPHQHLTLGAAFAGREIFEGRNGKHIDVFFDKLEFCHTVSFLNRLEKDRPTLPLAELILGKMQIVQINENDLKDTTVLLLEHDIGDNDTDVVNAERIAEILSNDWGFYYTVTTNLKKVDASLAKYELTNEEMRLVRTRIGKLLGRIEKEPKSMSWTLRGRVGTRKKWYRDVEESERAEWLSQASKETV